MRATTSRSGMALTKSQTICCFPTSAFHVGCCFPHRRLSPFPWRALPSPHQCHDGSRLPRGTGWLLPRPVIPHPCIQPQSDFGARCFTNTPTTKLSAIAGSLCLPRSTGRLLSKPPIRSRTNRLLLLHQSKRPSPWSSTSCIQRCSLSDKSKSPAVARL